MARLKDWNWGLWAPILIAAAMLAAFLPGSQSDPFFSYYRRTHSRAIDRASSRIRTAIAQHRARALQLAAASRRGRVTRDSLTVSYVAPFTRADAEAWASALVREQRATYGQIDRGRVNVVVAPWDSIQLLGRTLGQYISPGMLGAIDEPCVALIEGSADRLLYLEEGNSPALIGGCALTLAYGAPGRAIRSWLKPLPYWWDPIENLSRRSFDTNRVRLGRWEAGPELTSCLNEVEEGCANFAVSRPTGEFVAWLITRYGHEAFGRFWRHEGPIAVAAQNAFGRPLAEVGRERIASRFDLMFGKPRVTVRDLVAAAGALVLTLGLAMFAGRRRQVA